MPDKQDILLEQYKILHEATQAAHTYAWHVTSIFVPVISAGIVFAFKQPLDSIWAQVALLVTLIVIIWFWKGVLMFLDHCNSIRYDRLTALEKDLSDAYDVKFSFYRAFKDKKKPFYKNFSILTWVLVILLTMVLSIAMIATLAKADFESEEQQEQIAAQEAEIKELKKLLAQLQSQVGVLQTGQTICYDEGGNEIDCTGTGQDGNDLP